MTAKEFIDLGNKLSSLKVDLMNNRNVDLWVQYRNEKDRGFII